MYLYKYMHIKTNIGALRHILFDKFQNRAICIGWLHKSQLISCPSVKEYVTFTAQHRLIVIVRIVPIQQQAEGGGGGQSSSSSSSKDDGDSNSNKTITDEKKEKEKGYLSSPLKSIAQLPSSKKAVTLSVTTSAASTRTTNVPPRKSVEYAEEFQLIDNQDESTPKGLPGTSL
jgi:hypothetical protein